MLSSPFHQQSKLVQKFEKTQTLCLDLLKSKLKEGKEVFVLKLLELEVNSVNK